MQLRRERDECAADDCPYGSLRAMKYGVWLLAVPPPLLFCITSLREVNVQSSCSPSISVCLLSFVSVFLLIHAFVVLRNRAWKGFLISAPWFPFVQAAGDHDDLKHVSQKGESVCVEVRAFDSSGGLEGLKLGVGQGS